MFYVRKPRAESTLSTGSMADIAFLLLIFFLVATTLAQEKGLSLQLPPDVPPTEMATHERNLFKIHINSQNQFLVEDEIRKDLEGLTDEIKRFVLNPTRDPGLAESPAKAIVSIKTQRGTKYAAFIMALDQVKEAYYQLYGENIGLTSDAFRALDLSQPAQYERYERARAGFPMNISIANPN